MRFMALGNFFYNGTLHEAAPQQPHIFDFPDDEIPSITWRPLDAKAEAALKERCIDIEKRTGNKHRPFPIPKEYTGLLASGAIPKMERPAAVDPDALPAAAVAALTPKTTVGTITKGKRPSDQEPA